MFKRIFAWWDSATIGTSFTLWRTGAKLIGKDAQGNKYFEATGKNNTFADGRTRRWVVYHGVAESSRVPADWHGWLHHTVDEPPTKSPLTRREWETDHKPNMTGTPWATKPKGSLSVGGHRQKASGDYEAWSPDA